MRLSLLSLLTIFLLVPVQALAHFGIVIPTHSMVTEKSQASVKLDIAFSHPFSANGMDMQKPEQFFMLSGSGKTDLLPALAPASFMEHAAWQATISLNRPDVCQFVVVPRPYYEEAEDSFIIHYAKTVIGAYGEEEGWNQPCGLPLEIVPLSRPFGNYAGNLFSGTALLHGKPLANAIVEIENLNLQNAHRAPNPYFETQTVMTDQNGNFSFAVPWAGWWGFAVLANAPEKIELKGKAKSVELGGIIWVEFVEPIQNTGR